MDTTKKALYDAALDAVKAYNEYLSEFGNENDAVMFIASTENEDGYSESSYVAGGDCPTSIICMSAYMETVPQFDLIVSTAVHQTQRARGKLLCEN